MSEVKYVERVAETDVMEVLMASTEELRKQYPSTYKPSGEESAFYIEHEGFIIAMAAGFGSQEDDGYIAMAWVRQDWRGKGLYHELVNAWKGWCRERNFSTLGAGVHVGNENSLRIHQALGMHPVATYLKMKV